MLLLLFSHQVSADTLQLHRMQQARLLCTWLSPRICSSSTIVSVILSNHIILCYPLLLPSNFQTLGPFPLKQLFVLDGQHTGVSASASILLMNIQSVQFSSVAQSCPTLCDPMNCSTPGLPVHHKLPEPTQMHVHWAGDAIQPSHPLLSPSPPALNLSQHKGLFK